MEADAVIAVSQETRNDVLRCFPGVNPEKVVVIHNGIDLEQYRNNPSVEALADAGGSRATLCAVCRAGYTPERHNSPSKRDSSDRPVDTGGTCAGAPYTPEIGRGDDRGCGSGEYEPARRNLDPRDATVRARLSS